MLTEYERAARYLAAIPPTNEGGRNHALNRAGYALRENFPYLSAGEFEGLLWDHARNMSPPLEGEEVAKTIASAWTAAEAKGAVGTKARPVNGRSPSQTLPHQQTRKAAPPPVPIDTDFAPPMPEPMEDGARAFLAAMFGPEEGVRICRARMDDDGREVPEGEGVVMTCRKWLAKLDRVGGNPNAVFSSSGPGLFVGVNPMKPHGSRDADVTDFRHALVEFDSISLDEQWAILAASRVPLAAVTWSGGKSIHGLVKVGARDRAEYDARVATLYASLAAHGPDESCRNPSRFSRLPGARRGGARQELLALSMGAASWENWVATLPAAGDANQPSESNAPSKSPADSLPRVFAPSQLLAFDASQDPDCVIGFKDGRAMRYLCRGGSLLVVGPSGVGKSSLNLQMAICWGVGRHFCGISPGLPRKSLIVQSENDQGDLAEAVQGIVKHLELTQDEAALLEKNLVIVCEARVRGEEFLAMSNRLIDEHRPDLYWVDPFLGFAGFDVSRQDQTSAFLREGMQPILARTGVILCAVHHTGKPRPAKDTVGMTDIEWAYQGLGSSELVNYFRAVATLRPRGAGAFTFTLAKRGGRAGASHPPADCHPSAPRVDAKAHVYLSHGRDGIYWTQDPDPSEGIPEQRDDPPVRLSPLQELLRHPDVGSALRAVESPASAREYARALHRFAEKRKVSGKVGEETLRKKGIQTLLDWGKLARAAEEGLLILGPNI